MKKNRTTAILALFSLLALVACSTKQKETLQVKESEMNKITTEVSSDSTYVTTEEVEKKQSIIEAGSIPPKFDAIYIENNLVIGELGGYGNADWTIYDINLKQLNKYLNIDNTRNELAHTLETGYKVYNQGTALEVKDIAENRIYSTYLNNNSELATIDVGETEDHGNFRISSRSEGPYSIIPYRSGALGSQINFINGSYREGFYHSKYGTAIGSLNKNGLIPVLKQQDGKTLGKNTEVYIYDAKTKDNGTRVEGSSDLAPLKTIPAFDLEIASNINSKNRIMIKEYTTGLVDDPAFWTLYDINTDYRFSFPPNIEIVRYYDYGIESLIGEGEQLGVIGDAENYVYEDLNENTKLNDETPSNIDFTPRKKGIISADGTIVKEPFAFDIKEPNSNGIAPYSLEDGGKYGLININTGEIIKEPFALNIQKFNQNGLSALLIEQNQNYSIIDENGTILENQVYPYISGFTSDNLASFREEMNGSLGILKVNPSILTE